MGLTFTCVAASDRKKSAQKFIRANHDFTHVFVDAVAHAAGTGTCVGHPSFASCECSIGNRRSDLVIAGIPCHPFTKLRNKQGRGRSGPAEEHPDIDTIFHSFPKLLSTRRPVGFVVEETDAFCGGWLAPTSPISRACAGLMCSCPCASRLATSAMRLCASLEIGSIGPDRGLIFEMTTACQHIRGQARIHTPTCRMRNA